MILARRSPFSVSIQNYQLKTFEGDWRNSLDSFGESIPPINQRPTHFRKILKKQTRLSFLASDCTEKNYRMRKTRGFKVRKRLKKMFRWKFRARRKLKFLPLSKLTTGKSKPVFIISSMLKSLKRRAEKLCKTSRKGYIRVGDDPIESGKRVRAPKGHLAVYVGESAFETTTYFVPVIFFNHPQFQRLLELAEKVNGFNHPGRISIPCEVSEFEKVKKSIAASESFRWHRWSDHRRL